MNELFSSSEDTIPVYDREGNIIWPEYKSLEEIKKKTGSKNNNSGLAHNIPQ